MTPRTEAFARTAIGLVGAAVAAVVAYLLFVHLPTTFTELLGILLVLTGTALGAKIAGGIATSILSPYNVAEVAVEGPITRDGRGPFPSSPSATPADDIVEQIERADEDGSVKALVLRLNTPGGQIVPSDDIRTAAASFDGPTIAYATDVCASGGYWIASGCDELWAHEASLVGSIGVIGSRVNASDLADRLGLSYEQLTAGEYKDAGTPLKEFEEKDRAYLQGLIDEYYDHFVERVAEGRDLDADTVRETEARVYVGTDAYDRGLVDEIGTHQAVEEAIRERIGEEVIIEEFEPKRGVMGRFSTGAARIAHAVGAGAASVLVDRDRFDLRL